jgi:hypothetical protein
MRSFTAEARRIDESTQRKKRVAATMLFSAVSPFRLRASAVSI